MVQSKSQTKGKVTSLEFSEEEAQKAVKHVQDAIAEKNNELHRLRGFVTDNNNLINLVQKLPEQLSHDIMVPFGKAAFFPGRLIHTNEFLVFLGEGYYADRTSNQTIEILQRRGKSLDSQVDSLQAMIKNLEAEAEAFNATASEIAEGVVYIEEEDYAEEDSNKGESEPAHLLAFQDPPMQDAPHFGNAKDKDEEEARIAAIFDRLEKEELAAENDDNGDQNEETTADSDDILYQRPTFNNLQNSPDDQARPLDSTDDKILAMEVPKENNHQEDTVNQLNFASLAVQSQVREGKNSAQNVKTINPSKKPPIRPKEKISEATSASKNEVQHQITQPSFDSSKAFTGSIIERAENLQTSKEQSSISSQVSGSQPSKPISRFKMRRT